MLNLENQEKWKKQQNLVLYRFIFLHHIQLKSLWNQVVPDQSISNKNSIRQSKPDPNLIQTWSKFRILIQSNPNPNLTLSWSSPDLFPIWSQSNLYDTPIQFRSNLNQICTYQNPIKSIWIIQFKLVIKIDFLSYTMRRNSEFCYSQTIYLGKLFVVFFGDGTLYPHYI